MRHYSFFAMCLYCEPNVIDEEQHLILDNNALAVGGESICMQSIHVCEGYACACELRCVPCRETHRLTELFRTYGHEHTKP